MCLKSHLCLGSNLPNNIKVGKRKKENRRAKKQYSLIRRLYFEFSKKIFREEIDKVIREKVYKRLYFASKNEIKHFFITEFYYDKESNVKIIL